MPNPKLTLHLQAVKTYFQRWFHARTLVVAFRSTAQNYSTRKMLRLTFGAKSQLCAVVLLSLCGVFACYSAGRAIAANAVMQTQSAELRDRVDGRVKLFFSSLFPSPQLVQDTESTRMKAQIAELQKKVDELSTTNQTIVKNVSAKTSSHISELESIIRQTGLNPQDLKKQAEKSGKVKEALAEGGPFVPADLSALPQGSQKMLSSLDELNTLRVIVGNLPLGKPIKNAELESPFGNRLDPFDNEVIGFHTGVDLAAHKGATIFSTGDGKVVAAKYDMSYGNMIDIDHGFGIVTRYGHLSKINVKVGQLVKKGAPIGIQGQTGRATGPHLHYEVRYHDHPIDPQKFLNTRVNFTTAQG